MELKLLLVSTLFVFVQCTLDHRDRNPGRQRWRKKSYRPDSLMNADNQNQRRQVEQPFPPPPVVLSPPLSPPTPRPSPPRKPFEKFGTVNLEEINSQELASIFVLSEPSHPQMVSVQSEPQPFFSLPDTARQQYNKSPSNFENSKTNLKENHISLLNNEEVVNTNNETETKILNDQKKEVVKSLHEALSLVASSMMNERVSEDFLFGQYVGNSLRNITNIDIKLEVQHKILDAIMQAHHHRVPDFNIEGNIKPIDIIEPMLKPIVENHHNMKKSVHEKKTRDVEEEEWPEFYNFATSQR